MISPEQRATLRKSANTPSQLFDAGMMTLVLDALDAAEARATNAEQRLALLNGADRYVTGTESTDAVPHVGIALATEIYDCAGDPMTPIATCDTADEARDIVARLNAAEARIKELNQYIHQIQSERAAGALDGHAALEEANNRIVELERQMAARGGAQ